ncbi:MAG TPA: YegS/Rv2252/BmrU family lipid kinase [Sphingomonadaceae bacterium]|nr:YegS/Rv2252/BmrU family lipid kinase [Sphingomonadaceae bacterium]
MNEAHPPPRQAALIVNARSRKGRRLFREATALLKDAGIDLVSTRAERKPARMRKHIAEAIATGVPMVIVGGGDGSLSSAVDEFVGSDTLFALLPLGTANSFARSLGIPLDLPGAVGVIASGRRRRIDLGMIDGDYFANSAALGLSPLIAETVPDLLKRFLGRLGYVGWALFRLSRFQPFLLTVGEGAAAETIEALEVRIANGSYHGGAELVASARVDSGEIVVQAVVGRQLARLGWNYVRSLLRLPQRATDLREFRGRSLRIATDPPQPISIDGEVLARTPVTARIAPGVIEVAAPAAQPEG